MIKFAGVTEEHIHSIFRRGFVWKPLARFIDEAVISAHFPDANASGYFAKDDSLKDFLRSGPCIGAALQLKHGFELKHNKSECAMLTEGYASQPLTEDALRAACSLPPLSADLPVEMTSYCLLARSRRTWRKRCAKVQNVADAIRDECLNKSKLCITHKSCPSCFEAFCAAPNPHDERTNPSTKLEALFAVKPPGAKPETVYEELRDTPGQFAMRRVVRTGKPTLARQ